MAKDNNNGLYLPLKIDLSEWEKSLATADADLQKAMREMRSAMSDLKLRYDVEIANAKTAGDQLKVIELENKKLNNIYIEQKRVVESLNRVYQQSVQEKGVNAKASQDLARQLVRESKQLEKIQLQMNKGGLNIGKSISDGLANISPEFAKIRQMTASVTSSLSDMGITARTAIKALGGIGLAAAGVGAVVTGLNAITDSVNNIAQAGVKASDPIYQLRESIQGTYEDAEYLYRVTAVDGTNVNSLANSITKLDSVLLKDTEETNVATQALRRYGAELFDTNKKIKPYKEQLQELSKAAQNAAAHGEFANFKASLPGAFRSTEFDHLLLGLSNYETKAKAASTSTKILYDELHELTDWTNAVALAQQNLDMIKGGFVAGPAIENLKNEVDTLKAEAKILEQNRKEYEATGKSIGNLTNNWTEFKSVISIAWQDILADTVAAYNKADDYVKLFKELSTLPLKLLVPGSEKMVADQIFNKDFFSKLSLETLLPAWVPLINDFKDRLSKASEQLAPVKAEVKKEREDDEAKQKLEEEKKKQQELTKLNEVETQKEKQEEQKKAKLREQQIQKEVAMRERYSRELRDVQATDYEREINALKDKINAYMKDGLTEVEAHELYTKQKEKIDQKYYEKQQQERQKQIKQAEDAYNKEIEMAKKAREAAISDAEQTLRNNLKLVKYIQAEQKKGTYSEDKAKQYAENLYLKANGFNRNDISFLKEFGQEELKKIADARSRLFKDFAQNIGQNIGANTENGFGYFNKNLFKDFSTIEPPTQQQQQQQQTPVAQPVQVTINFDNTVVEDVSTMDKLANKVADVITPAIQNALNGNVQYNYS